MILKLSALYLSTILTIFYLHYIYITKWIVYMVRKVVYIGQKRHSQRGVYLSILDRISPYFVDIKKREQSLCHNFFLLLSVRAGPIQDKTQDIAQQ